MQSSTYDRTPLTLSTMTGADSTPTISSAVMKLRKILADNMGKDSIYGKAANGTILVVVHADSKVCGRYSRDSSFIN
jgi:hypothetical protein